ncbi:hypothetical protein GCM10010116_31790 [Microbispora rosea subsp. aerata]|nr:hypothetical protein [Microbispora rosea]GGO15803.1 hypothetical protein GCM10010116_31790 [Microbispora rosea subsp. aerata]GIH58691.1 hypothetical protein Mro02_56050 [Microbispora rosea subsp. aerata]GLJ86940.1 hypothetical protein GCM10017588_56830 [Microbispora rosea subsp. aerata]
MRRWDSDERFTGIADASAMAPQVSALLEAMARDGWVTEAPEVHLLPHLRRACGSEWLLTRERLLDDGVYEVTVTLAGDREGVDVHRDAIRLLSAIAEAVFFVRQTGPGVFECVTGLLDGDSQGFGGHGHMVRLIVT